MKQPIIGYCVKCRKKTKIKNAKLSKTSKARVVAKGTCFKCGTNMAVFLKDKEYAQQNRPSFKDYIKDFQKKYKGG